MTDLHTKVFQSQRLTADFVKKHGFSFSGKVVENEFTWKQFLSKDYPVIVIFFNYFSNGQVTYDVLFEDIELHNIDKSRFVTLLNMLKK